MLLEVREHCTGIVSDISKVHRLPADLEQQQAVEHLEELARGLVDRAEDRLAGLVRELAQEGDDRPGALRVQAGGRLVEKEEEFRLRTLYQYGMTAALCGERTFATSSTAIVVRFLNSTFNVPTTASP